MNPGPRAGVYFNPPLALSLGIAKDRRFEAGQIPRNLGIWLVLTKKHENVCPRR